MNEVCDAGQIAEEVIAQLSSARVTVRLGIEAEVPDGVPDKVVRIKCAEMLMPAALREAVAERGAQSER